MRQGAFQLCLSLLTPMVAGLLIPLGTMCGPFPRTPALLLGERENRNLSVTEPSANSSQERRRCGSLSSGERAGVRGNGPSAGPTHTPFA